MWGTSLRQRLRLSPLFVATCVADVLAPMLPARSAPREDSQPGISVVIPERDAPAMLEEALAAACAALEPVREPHEIIVVVNGARAEAYAALRAKYDRVCFLFHEAPLSFTRAIAAGLAQARFDWTLLLNNDMRLAPDAVAALARHRADDVFAVAAQIFQRSADGRREETGFTDWYVDGDGVHLFHAPVPQNSGAIAHLCASGGAAVFRTSPLRRYVDESTAYDPFYWEDAEWSVRAWRDGWRVLFVPAAHAEHRHRATTSRFYDSGELERIVERNRLLFDLRQHVTRNGKDTLMRRVCDLPYPSQRELSAWSIARGVLAQRIHACRGTAPLDPPVLWSRTVDSVRLPAQSYGYRLRAAAQSARPRLLLVTPFAIFPPRHGGARRIAELLRALRADYDVILVSDEAQVYDARSFAYMDDLAAVYLVQRREGAAVSSVRAMDRRMHEHAHGTLVETVRRALRDHHPALVQIEHAELAHLVELRNVHERWILGLHDACRATDFTSEQAFDAFQRDILSRFDAVTVCSNEDAALVHHPRVVRVPNGSAVRLDDYQPSGGHRLLFLGPFRYAPNALGITRFLREAYPGIRAAVPDVELLVLGGDEALPITRDDPLFQQPGVSVLGHRDDVPSLLGECTMTVNPQTDILGSAVKLVESLSAGRICVSTDEGARGFHEQGFAALVVVPDVASMHAPIIDLLHDSERRRQRETPEVSRLVPYQWSACARLQDDLYRSLLAATVST